MLKALAAASVVLLAFFGTLLVLSYLDQPREAANICQSAGITPLGGPYSRLDGHAYKARVPSLEALSDNNANLFRSPIMLCEDNQPLGPPHAFWADIADRGAGRFSHFGDSVIFSSSDNTDPNSTGRRYAIVNPAGDR